VRAVLYGPGAVGIRAARQLHGIEGLTRLTVAGRNQARAGEVVASLGSGASAAPWSTELVQATDVLVLTTPQGHRALAEAALAQGVHVVSVTDDVDEVRSLLQLDFEARERGLSVVIGAGLAPGLSCVLARHAAADFSSVEEVHVAKVGTAGKACARQHHRALDGEAIDWRDGTWSRRTGGSGRELCWFPDPIGALDCYRAALPDALLLAPAFPGVERVTARVAAPRRDRLTARLPMLRPSAREGAIGAVRVEVRGRRGAAHDVRVLGALDRPGSAAGAVAAQAASWAVAGRFARPGAAGLGELVADTVPFLRELAERGVRAALFEGHGAG